MLQSIKADDERFLDRLPGDLVERHDGCPGVVVAKPTGQVLVLWAFPEPIVDYSRLVLPIVRRVVPVLVANDLIKVQPMSLPSGLFYLNL